MILFATWAFLPTSWKTETYRPYAAGEIFSYDTITIIAPFVTKILLWASVIVAACLLILSVLAYKWPVIRFPSVARLFAIVIFPCAGLTHTFLNLGPWTIYGRVTDSAGQSYVFCDSSFLQGQIMAIASVETENLLFSRLKVLGTNNGDSPRSWASVIRPANPQNTYGQLYLTDQHMLAGVRFNNNCYLAYDLASKKIYGHGDIEKISPFICLDKDDEIHLPDIDTIWKRIKEGKPGVAGYPHRDALESAIRHPNQKVRDVAESFLSQIAEQPVQPGPR